MENWLVKRLTPAKQQEPRWADFARAVEKIWEEFFDPDISRLERLRSSYTADDRDLARQIRLMGDYFSYELPKEEDKPIALAWRRLEIDYKDMELILRSAFRRHFGDFRAEWYPLFAPTDRPYGEKFIVGDFLHFPENKNVPPKGHFLTSRGIVGVNALDLYRAGMDKATFRREAIPLVTRIKPLHIVFDGFLWFMRYDLGTFTSDFTATWRNYWHYELQFGPLGARFDYLAGDARHLDIDIFETWAEAEHLFPLDFWGQEMRGRTLDLYLPDGFADRVPLDLLIPILSEKEGLLPFNLLLQEVEQRFYGEMSRAIGGYGQRSEWDVGIPVAAIQPFIRAWESEYRPAIPFISPYALDRYLPDGFADIVPLDVLQRPSFAERLYACPLDVVYRESARRWSFGFLDPFRYPYTLPRVLDLYLPDGFADRFPLDTVLGDFFVDGATFPFTVFFRTTDQYTEISFSVPELAMRQQTHETFDISFVAHRACRLDDFLPDGFADRVPLDLLIPLNDKGDRQAFSLVFQAVEQCFSAAMREAMGRLKAQTAWRVELPVPALDVAHEEYCTSTREIPAFQAAEPRLDQIPCFDEIPGDFIPLDYPYGGYV